MIPGAVEPAIPESERPQTHASDRAAAEIIQAEISEIKKSYARET